MLFYKKTIASSYTKSRSFLTKIFVLLFLSGYALQARDGGGGAGGGGEGEWGLLFKSGRIDRFIFKGLKFVVCTTKGESPLSDLF